MSTDEKMPTTAEEISNATQDALAAKGKWLQQQAQIQTADHQIDGFLRIIAEKFRFIKRYNSVMRISGEEFPIQYKIVIAVEIIIKPLEGEDLEKYLAEKDEHGLALFPTEKSKKNFLDSNRFTRTVSYVTNKIVPFAALQEKPEKVEEQMLRILNQEMQLRINGKMSNRGDRRMFRRNQRHANPSAVMAKLDFRNKKRLRKEKKRLRKARQSANAIVEFAKSLHS